MALQNTLAQSAVTIRYKNGIDQTGVNGKLKG